MDTDDPRTVNIQHDTIVMISTKTNHSARLCSRAIVTAQLSLDLESHLDIVGLVIDNDDILVDNNHGDIDDSLVDDGDNDDNESVHHLSCIQGKSDHISDARSNSGGCQLHCKSRCLGLLGCLGNVGIVEGKLCILSVC